jgi:putative inorganic carbon (hco3(-)) transporter
VTKNFKITWLYIISGIFIILNGILIAREFYWFALLPVALMVGIMFLFSLDKLLLLIVFFTPVAINIRDFDAGLSVSLPTEPLMFGVLLLFLFKLIFEKKYDTSILRHPISIAILINLLWLLTTSVTSEMPLISFKFLLSRLWFVVPFFFIGTQLFARRENISRFVWLYTIPLMAVIAYSTHALYSWGFDEQAAHWVMSPFYNDHTAYGAAIALFVPVVAGFLFGKESTSNQKFLASLALLVLLAGLYFSYSRAAWISVLVAAGFSMILLLKIKLRYIILTLGLLFCVFFYYKNEILWKLEKNKQDSSTNFVEHVQSISNISSDASNLERINRWQSALRMFSERPFWGWGPGTYQFLYAPYQHSKEKTIISTNAGDKGNAHSEYIGPLAESGVIGLLSVLGIVFTTIWTGVRLFKQATDKTVKRYSLMFLVALITYWSHGVLNNFLDTDKAAVPYWGFSAILVALDIYHRKKNTTEKKEGIIRETPDVASPPQ